MDQIDRYRSPTTVTTQATISYNVPLATWPQQRLPEPQAPYGWPYLVTPAGAIVAETWIVDEPPRPRPYHEVYLHLSRLDLGREDEINRFLLRFGPLAVHGEDALGFDWHAGYADHVARDLRAAGGTIVSEMAYWDNMAGDDYHFLYSQSLAAFRWQAWCIRDLLRAWRWLSEGLEPDRWESPVWQSADPHMPIPDSPLAAGKLLAQGIRNGLSPFHPELRVGGREDDPHLLLPYGAAQGFYYICCLELFNHIAEEATYRTCANEPCGRLFVRQYGGAEQGQHRTSGVKFCTPGCARAQAQREYRRRKRAEKERSK